MTSTAPLTVPADPVVPAAPSLGLATPPSADPADPSASAPSRPRFRRLVVFTGQLA